MSDIITQLRKYRLDLENKPFLNDESRGVALFDFTSSFLGAYILEKFFNISKRLNINLSTYYLLVVPIGVIVHLLTNTNTFLGGKLLNYQWNIYKIVVLLSLVVYYLNL
jgi:hypothetical protein